MTPDEIIHAAQLNVVRTIEAELEKHTDLSVLYGALAALLVVLVGVYGEVRAYEIMQRAADGLAEKILIGRAGATIQ